MINKIRSLLTDIIRSIDKLFTIPFFILDSQSMVKYLKRWRIAKTGENCWIAPSVRFDLFKNKFAKQLQQPLVTIGNNCVITEYTQLITHDTSKQFFCKVFSKPQTKKWGGIVIEDNCFIGAGCIILPGVTIRQNSLIGAGSVVTKDVEPNSVYAGNPAKKIMSIHGYIEKS